MLNFLELQGKAMAESGLLWFFIEGHSNDANMLRVCGNFTGYRGQPRVFDVTRTRYLDHGDTFSPNLVLPSTVIYQVSNNRVAEHFKQVLRFALPRICSACIE